MNYFNIGDTVCYVFRKKKIKMLILKEQNYSNFSKSWHIKGYGDIHEDWIQTTRLILIEKVK